MKLSFVMISLVLAGNLLAAPPASDGPKVGKPAPNFSATDIEGNKVDLNNLKGKIVVLEWYNKGCPFVKKHYNSGNMQKLQKTYTGQGVAWITINSSAKGKEGYMTDEEAKANKGEADQTSTVINDPEGTVGKLYHAKTTPHMFVIDKKGTLVYAGAIDDNDSANPRVIAGSKNYVAAAVNSVLKGEKVSISSTKPYGCSVKYN